MNVDTLIGIVAWAILIPLTVVAWRRKRFWDLMAALVILAVGWIFLLGFISYIGHEL